MKPTVRNIAELAGVSPTSVSMVLNDRPIRVSEETRAKILETAKSLGYSKKIRATKDKGDTGVKTVGLIYPNHRNTFWNSCITSIEDHAASLGYRVLATGNCDTAEKMAHAIQVLKKVGTKGLILIAPDDVNEDNNHVMTGSALHDYKKPFVLIDRAIDRVFCDFITIDNRQAGYMATEQLIMTGAEKIGVIIGEKSIYSTRERVAGYKEALSFYDYSIDETHIHYGSYDELTGIQGAKRLIDKGVEAIFAGVDEIARGVYRYCQQESLRIGKDISVIGIDNTSVGEWMSPALTSIDQPSESIGRRAIEILSKRIEKVEIGAVKDLLFVPNIEERNSLAPSVVVRGKGLR